MRPNSEKLLPATIIVFVTLGLGCIDFDRIGQAPPHDLSNYSYTSNGMEHVSVAPTQRGMGSEEILDDAGGPLEADTWSVGILAIGWVSCGLIVLAALSWLSYRRYRAWQIHGVGSALRPLGRDHREALPVPRGSLTTTPDSPFMSSRALVSSRLSGV